MSKDFEHFDSLVNIDRFVICTVQHQQLKVIYILYIVIM